jgi:hypothetical protein
MARRSVRLGKPNELLQIMADSGQLESQRSPQGQILVHG